MFKAIIIAMTLANFQQYASISPNIEGGKMSGMYYTLNSNGRIDRVMSVAGPNIIFDITDKPTITQFNTYPGTKYADAIVPATGLFQDRIEMAYGNFLIISLYSSCLCNEIYTLDTSGNVNAVYGNEQDGDNHNQTIRQARGLRKFTFPTNPSEATYLADHIARVPTKASSVTP